MVIIIVAHAENRVIGKADEIPWYVREDMEFFKEATMGKPVIMGRKTYESIPDRFKPLPGRTTYILTRDPNYNVEHPNVKIAHDLEKAIFEAKLVSEEVYIAGGAQIYEQALQYTDRVLATVLSQPFDGDTYFPQLSSDEWHMIEGTEDFHDENLDLFYRRFIYQKKKGL